jgi:hypothetical protein
LPAIDSASFPAASTDQRSTTTRPIIPIAAARVAELQCDRDRRRGGDGRGRRALP